MAASYACARPKSRTRRRVVDWLTAVKLPARRDSDDRGPLGKLNIRHAPGRVRLFGVPLVKSFPLLGWRDVEVVQLHLGTEIGRSLPKGGALVPAPEAIVDDHVDAQFESAQRDVDEPSFDDIGGG